MASVHPSLRNVLDIPESTPPRPRPGRRQPQGPTRVRRIPGPPPPQSWLLKSKFSKERIVPSNDVRTLQHQSVKLPGAVLLEDNSLQHMVLKTIALDWNNVARYDHLYLTQIRLMLRETLLSYLAIFADGDEPISNPLSTLFPIIASVPPDAAQDTGLQDESQDVRRLDLTNALGRWLSLRGLKRALLVTGNASQQIAPRSSRSDPETSNAKEVPDSWEEAEEDQHQHSISQEGSPSFLVHISRFQNLQHLSLALDPNSPSSTVSWSSFLAIASHLQTLESLSLAYWPLPTYTPEAAATFATVTSNFLGKRRSIAYGGTNMYSAQENDWRESSGILKSLSRSLYCLRWLDLTGCVAWLPALVWQDDVIPIPFDDELEPVPQPTEEQVPTSIWNGYWRGIEWLGLGVGWTPDGQLEDESYRQLARNYNALREKVQVVAKQVTKSRIAGKGKMVTIDCGDAPIEL